MTIENFTNKEFSDYVFGWLESRAYHRNELSMEDMKSALANALAMIDDSQDGVESYVERRGEVIGGDFEKAFPEFNELYKDFCG